MRADRDREPEPRKALRPKQGLIQNTICAILAEATEPLQAHAVRNEVETRLGRPISLDTVTSCLSGSARDSRSTVARVGYGLYAWRHQPSPRTCRCRRRTESKKSTATRTGSREHPSDRETDRGHALAGATHHAAMRLVLDPFAARVDRLRRGIRRPAVCWDRTRGLATCRSPGHVLPIGPGVTVPNGGCLREASAGVCRQAGRCGSDNSASKRLSHSVTPIWSINLALMTIQSSVLPSGLWTPTRSGERSMQ